MSDAQGKERLLQFFGMVGKRVIVTGGGSGMGAAGCRLLADAGATVAVADLNQEAATATAEAIVASGGKARGFPVDVVDEAKVTECFQQAVAWMGGIDVLIHSAAIYPRIPLLSVTAEQWDRIQAVNVRGTMFALRAAIHAMMPGEGGSIVLFSSIGSERVTTNDHVTYSASKAAVNALTWNSAMEFGPRGIRVNAILPGMILSSTAAATIGGNPPSGPILEPGRIPLGGPGKVDDVAGLVLFLASPASRYLTGQMIAVDGGFMLS